MRRAKLEQDMVSEQKNLFGFMSYRQAIYCGISILIMYAFVPYIFKFFNAVLGIIFALIASLLFIMPIIFVVIFLAFTRNPTTKYYRDKDFLIRFNHKHNVGYWRKGTNQNLKDIHEEYEL